MPHPLASRIEHTLLKPQAQHSHIQNLCQQAVAFNFGGVCVNPFWVHTAKEMLQGSDVKLVSVVGFPFGATLSSQKVIETQRLVQIGIDEVDMVINIGALKDRDYEFVSNDIRSVKKAAKEKPLKVIIETCLLTYAEKVQAIQLCKQVGADFVKTSTGVNGAGAMTEDIELIRSIVGNQLRIKASGGIKTRAFAEELVAAGADRIGTSSSVHLVTEESV